MSAPSSSDTLLQQARQRASAGEWQSVRDLLEGERALARKIQGATVLLAEALMRLGQSREARAWLDETLPDLERAGDRSALRRAVNLSGVAHWELGDLARAEAAWSRAVEFGRADGDDLLVARAMNNLAAVADLRGHREVALSLYELAIPAYQRLGNVRGLAESYHNMAITVRELGRLERADELEQRAMEFAIQAEDRRLATMARVGRAEIRLRSGDALLASAEARVAARAFAELGDRAQEADALRLAGASSLDAGDSVAAAATIDRAVTLAEASGNALITAEALEVRARARDATGNVTGARADLELARDLFLNLGATSASDRTVAALARLA